MIKKQKEKYVEKKENIGILRGYVLPAIKYVRDQLFPVYPDDEDDEYIKNLYKKDHNNILIRSTYIKNSSRYTGLCFQGGGVKGIVYAGVIRYLEEIDYLDNINFFSGSSIGSVISLLLVLGYDSDFIIKWIMRKDFPSSVLNGKSEYVDNSFVGLSYKAYKIFKNFGLSTSEHLGELFKSFIADAVNSMNIKRKGKIIVKSRGEETFQEIYDIFGKDLMCTGTCYNLCKVAYFSRFHSPTMPVYIAVMISCCYPGKFAPILYNDHLWGDGGIIQNFPIVASSLYTENILGFIILNNPSNETLGTVDKIKWENINEIFNPNSKLPFGAPPRCRKDYMKDYKEITDLFSFFSGFIKCLENSQISPLIPYDMIDDVVEIPVNDDISTLSTYLEPRIKEKYINVGYNTTREFFHNK